MARKGWSNVTLFFIIISTAILSHVFTLSMIPPREDPAHGVDGGEESSSSKLPSVLSHLSTSKVRRRKIATGKQKKGNRLFGSLRDQQTGGILTEPEEEEIEPPQNEPEEEGADMDEPEIVPVKKNLFAEIRKEIREQESAKRNTELPQTNDEVAGEVDGEDAPKVAKQDVLESITQSIKALDIKKEMQSRKEVESKEGKDAIGGGDEINGGNLPDVNGERGEIGEVAGHDVGVAGEEVGEVLFDDRNKASKTAHAEAVREAAYVPAAAPTTRDRLELLHIPRTGGTAMTLAAARLNVTWGACHFGFSWKRRAETAFKICPRTLRDVSLLVDSQDWQLPLENLNHLPYNPYDNLADERLASKPKEFFAVVRDPYARFISAFYADAPVEEGQNTTCKDSPEDFNAFATAGHAKLEHGGFSEVGVFRPQHEYVYHSNGTQLVSHIIKFESLREDFRDLHRQYGLNLTLGKVEPPRCSNRLKITYLSAENLRWINDLYAKDFVHFGYAPVSSIVSKSDAVSDRAVAKSPIVQAVAAVKDVAVTQLSTSQQVTASSETKVGPLSESSWIGNDWFPPQGSKLYDAHALKELFKNRKILWIGDAELRLSYVHLMTILNGDSSLIEVSDLKDTSAFARCKTDKSLDFCTALSGATLDFQSADCSKNFQQLEHMDVSKYDLVILGLGTWDVLGLCENGKDEKVKLLSSVLLKASTFPKPVVWTTMGLVDDAAAGINDQMMRFVASHQELSHIDFGSGMKLRTEEIFEKTKRELVFTTVARMAYVQMLANHLSRFQSSTKEG